MTVPEAENLGITADDPLVGEVTLAEAQEQDPPVVEEEKQAGDSRPMEKYQIGWWHDKPNFGCPHKRDNGKPCRFVTIDQVAMKLHIDKTHPVSWLEGVE